MTKLIVDLKVLETGEIKHNVVMDALYHPHINPTEYEILAQDVEFDIQNPKSCYHKEIYFLNRKYDYLEGYSFNYNGGSSSMINQRTFIIKNNDGVKSWYVDLIFGAAKQYETEFVEDLIQKGVFVKSKSYDALYKKVHPDLWKA